MSRRIAREIAVQSLFQIDFNEVTSEEAVLAALNEHLPAEVEESDAAYNDIADSQKYALELVEGVLTNVEEIDERLSKYATGWTLERMPATDRNILRVAVYEYYHVEPKLPAAVVINEAVELAKLYGTDESPRFVNGVLGKLVRE